jgi:hypothetical protein
VTDPAARYLLSCEALESKQEALAITAFERPFQERGLRVDIYEIGVHTDLTSV